MKGSDFFVAFDEILAEMMDELNNANYGLVKDNVTKLSDMIKSYKKSIEDRKNMTSNSIDLKILDRVYKIIEAKLGVIIEKVQLNSNIVEDLGADSLEVVELIMAFEDEFDIEIPDDEAESIKTVKEIVEYISYKIKEKLYK